MAYAHGLSCWAARCGGRSAWSLLLLGSACGQDRTWLVSRAAAAPAARDAAVDAAAAGRALPGATLVEDWPLIFSGVESRQFSSFDRAGGNDDGFTGRYSTLVRKRGTIRDL